MSERVSLLKSKLSRSMLIQGVCFALCFFAFQLTEFTVNDQAERLLGSNSVTAVYSVGILFTALGFLSFSVFRRIFRSERARKATLCVIGAVAVISSILLLTSSNQAMFLANAVLSLLSFGSISGCVYYNCSMTFFGNAYTGRVIGISMGCAVVLQFIVQNLLITSAAFIISITASVIALLYFVIKPAKDWMFENPLPYTSENKTDSKSALVLVVAVVIMSLVCALLDGVVMPAHASGQTSVSNFVRLVYAVSLVVAGFVADAKQRKILPLFTVCFMFLSTISSAFFSNAVTYWIGTAFIYLYSGFYVIFLTVLFLDFAPKSHNPPLWAGMGRIARSLTVAAATLPTAMLYNRFGNIALVAGSCVLSVLLLLIMIKDISVAVVPEKEPERTNAADLSKEEAIKRYAEYYSFTPRETDVFIKLITTEDGVQEIADGLFISRRVLQRYIADIYEKTSTKTRIGLFQSYTGFHLK